MGIFRHLGDHFQIEHLAGLSQFRQGAAAMSSCNVQPDVEQCPRAGFSLRGSIDEASGIHFIHLVDRPMAEVGELLTYTTSILNATSETLTNVCLQLRSFTNEQMVSLPYATQPSAKELTACVLGPCQSLTYSFTYMVTTRDALSPGLIISALQAELTSPSMGQLYSECDATTYTTGH